MNADELAHALADLRNNLNTTRGLVNDEKNSAEGRKRRIDTLVGTANGQGNIQLLRAAATEYRKASDHVRDAHDLLREAADALQGYLSANFRQVGSGSAGGGNGSATEWSAISTIGSEHTALSTRAQNRAVIRNALLVGAKAAYSAVKVGAVAGTLIGALVGGMPLIAAVVAAGAVSVGLDIPVYVTALFKHVYELRRHWVSGSATRDGIKAEVLSRIAKEGIEYGIGKIPVLGEPFGLAMDIKTLVELVKDLREVP